MLAHRTRIDVRADLTSGLAEALAEVQSASEALAAGLPSWSRAYSAIFR